MIQLFRNPIMTCLSVMVLVLGISYCGIHGVYMQWLPIIFVTIILFGAFGAGYIHFPKSWNNKYVLYLSAVSYAFFWGQKFVWFPTKFILRYINFHIGNITFIIILLLACIITAILLHKFVEKKEGSLLKKKLLISNVSKKFD